MYCTFIFYLHVGLCEKINQIYDRIMCNVMEEKKRMALVIWEKVCRPKILKVWVYVILEILILFLGEN